MMNSKLFFLLSLPLTILTSHQSIRFLLPQLEDTSHHGPVQFKNTSQTHSYTSPIYSYNTQPTSPIHTNIKTLNYQQTSPLHSYVKPFNSQQFSPSQTYIKPVNTQTSPLNTFVKPVITQPTNSIHTNNYHYTRDHVHHINSTHSHISHNLPGRSSLVITREHSSPETTRAHQKYNKTKHDVITEQMYTSHATEHDMMDKYNVETMRTSVHSSHYRLQPSQQTIARPIETPGPFAPRFQVAKWEITDEEWEEEIRDGFETSGLVPEILPGYPSGLVNINFNVHACVHLGTSLQANVTSSLPSRISYPADKHRLYTLVMMDVELRRLHYLVINIPGSDVAKGQEVSSYHPPEPVSTSPDGHRYLTVSLLQSGAIDSRQPEVVHRSSSVCQYSPRENFHLRKLMNELGLKTVAAANYFMVYHDQFVDSIKLYCRTLQADMGTG